MPDALTVHLNRESPHSIAVAPAVFETDGSFDVVLTNHGAALHVHLHLDDDLSRGATIDSVNHYVDSDGVERVPVRVRREEMPAEGRLKIVTGYGSETAYASVTLDEVSEKKPPVQVDERLARPSETAPVPTERPPPWWKPLPYVIVVLLAAIAAIGTAVVVDGRAGAIGLAILVVGVLVAVILLRT